MILKFNLQEYIETNYKNKNQFAKDLGVVSPNVDYWLKTDWILLHYKSKANILKRMLPDFDFDWDSDDGENEIALSKGGVNILIHAKLDTTHKDIRPATYDREEEGEVRKELYIDKIDAWINDEFVECELTNDIIWEFYNTDENLKYKAD